MISNLTGASDNAPHRPMVNMKTLSQLRDEEQREDANSQSLEINKKEVMVSGLAAHITSAWNEAYHAKQEHESQMLKDLRQRKGIYENRILAAIRKEGGNEIFLKLTDVKCRGAKASISDIMLSQDDIWTLEHTPIPDLSYDKEEAMIQTAIQLVQSGQFTEDEAAQMLEDAEGEIKKQLNQLAKESAENMSTLIKDQLAESEFESELKKYIDDIVTFGTGVLKGPIVKRKAVLSWSEDFKPIVEEKVVVDISRVSPLDVYPSAHSTTFDDGPCCFIHRLLPDNLYKMLGIKGNKEKEIREILELYGTSGLKEWSYINHTERFTLEGKNTAYDHTSNYITAVEYRGSAQGKLLIEWGMDPARIQDPLKTYSIEGWLIDGRVVRCVLNGDPLGKKPFSKSPFSEIPGSFWGQSVPNLMADTQSVCNASVRALVDNLGIASGPQVAIDPTALPAGETLTNIHPWKIWQIKQGMGTSGKLPIHFFQPKLLTNELLQIYEKFAKYADEVTGIPAYTYGDPKVGGAGQTASGLSMLLQSASKNLKEVIKSIDESIKGIIYRLYVHNMLYSHDEKVKGDINVVVLGSNALLHKDAQQMRRMNMLTYTNNPVDLEIIGQEGRAKMLKEAFKPLDYDTSIVPTPEELRQKMVEKQQAIMKEEQAMLAQQGGGGGNPVGGEMGAMG